MARHRILCTQRSQTVVCSFLVEQHGKNILDAAFGAVSRFIQEAALKRPIFDIQDLLGAVTAGARSAKRHDPRGPKVECAVGGLWGAQGIAAAMGTAFRFQSDPNLLLDLEASVYGELPKCRLYNHVFSDNREGTLMSYDHPAAVAWKKEYLEGEQSWQQPPPDIGEETVLVRREKDQRQHPAHNQSGRLRKG